MHLSLDDFCEHLRSARKSHAEMALAILWFRDCTDPGCVMSAGQLAKIIDDHHLGVPHSTRMAEAIRRSRLASETSKGFSLKPGSRRVIRDWFPDLDGIQPAMDHRTGYLPEAIWKNTRGYIEAVCKELNGSFKAAYYNAAAVMLRRLLETLIIEAYEYLGRESEIKDAKGDYLMLKELVDRACSDRGHRGINLGRGSKDALRESREIGNWAAHARRYTARASDLTKVQSGVRLVTEELIHIANLKRPRS